MSKLTVSLPYLNWIRFLRVNRALLHFLRPLVLFLFRLLNLFLLRLRVQYMTLHSHSLRTSYQKIVNLKRRLRNKFLVDITQTSLVTMALVPL